MISPDNPEWLDEEAVDWESEEAVVGAAERFLNRVSALFPVHDDIWDVDLEIIEWRLWEIPVVPMGYDEWVDGWDDLKEPAPYLLHIRTRVVMKTDLTCATSLPMSIPII